MSSRIDKKRSNNIVWGYRAKIIRMFMIINILFLSVLTIRNPVKAITILKSVQRKRGSIQGLPKISKYVKAGGRYFISENIPGWPSAAFNHFFRGEIGRIIGNQRRYPLSTVIFAITSRCRLKCFHCYEWNNISHKDILTQNDLFEIINKLKEYGLAHIQLSGGEPLERFEDLIRLIRFSRRRTDLWLLTSGFGLTYEKAMDLKLAGLTGADISLDHWEEEEHNKSRHSPESFYWVKEAVNNCKMAGLATSLSLCAFKSFVSYQNLLRYAGLAKEWGIGIIRILEPREAGRYTGKNISLGNDQILILEKVFQELNSSNKFIDYPIVTYPGYNQRRTGCLGAGNRYFYIDSTGNIHACPFCQKSAGNAVTDNFEKAVKVLKSYGCQKYEMNLSE